MSFNIRDHPIFPNAPSNADIRLTGAETILVPSFVMNMNGFPSLPKSLSKDVIFNLGNHFNELPLNTQRNFWAYLMIECDTETYEKFVKVHSKEVQESVSPVC